MSFKIPEEYSIRKKAGLFLGIIALVIILIMPTPEGMKLEAQKTLAVTSLMAIWWITEAIPIAATALIPLPVYPLLGIMDASKVSAPYADQNIFLFMGGLFIAMAMQRWNLHRRIAVNIIRIVGESPRKLVLGFMVSSGFLSMWISDTATVMMMMPIGLAVILHFEDQLKDKDPRFMDNFATAVMLGIAYAAVIGGIGTLIGTPPNIVFAGMIRKMFPLCPEITFTRWMLVGLPITVIFLPIVWIYLTRIAAPLPKKGSGIKDDVIEKEILKLGKMQKAEKLTLVVFCTTALLWMFRESITIGSLTIPGWSSLFPWAKYIKDSTVGMTMGLLLFLIPVDFKKGIFVLNWESARKLPWRILILFGGGFALATAVKDTELALWIGSKIALFGTLPPILLIFSVCIMMTFLTEVTSNTAVTTIMMPILAITAVKLEINPILLMAPTAISASCAFMLPVATPGNAIVFGSGYLTIPCMAKTGLALNFVGAIIITIIVYAVAIPVFGIVLGEVPIWIK